VIDYDRLIVQFGSERLSPELVERVERITGRRAHHLLRRGLFFSHRDLGALLDAYEAGRPFYLYTGRGPSSPRMHVGHLVPFLLTRWLQEAFQVPVVIQLTDDEKFLWRGGNLSTFQSYALENARDIVAMGFDPELTYLFTDTGAIAQLYPTVLRIQRLVTCSQVRGIFGFSEADCIGKHAFPAVQAAPAFSEALPLIFPGQDHVPCLIPCAIDQDPYFRMTRDVAPRLGWKKPALLHSKFFPALTGSKTKMSASDASTTIYVSDTPEMIKSKVNKYAFSGGQVTTEDQKTQGANLEVDVSYQWMRFFCDDDATLERLAAEYGPGPVRAGNKMLTGEAKKLLVETLQPIIARHQQARAAVTDEMVEAFMAVRKLHF